MTHLVGNQWLAGSGDAMASLNPFSGETVWKGNAADAELVEKAVAEARRAFLTWRKTSFEERQALAERYAELVKDNGEHRTGNRRGNRQTVVGNPNGSRSHGRESGDIHPSLPRTYR